MPLRLFRSRNVTGANIVMGLLVVGFFGMFFLGALYLQEILGYSPLEVGLAFLPSCIVMGTLSLGYAERLIMGIGARRTLIAGLVFAAAGLLAVRARAGRRQLRRARPAGDAPARGGAGLAFPALMTLAMSGATQSDSGLASGFVNTTVQVGGAIGLAVLATLATERTDALRADGVGRDAALNSGFHLAYLIGAALVGGRHRGRRGRAALGARGRVRRQSRPRKRRRFTPRPRRPGGPPPAPLDAHASISGPEKGGGPTESHAYRDAGGAGPLGGRPFPPSRERRRGVCRVRAALAESTPSAGEKRRREDVPPGWTNPFLASNRT